MTRASACRDEFHQDDDVELIGPKARLAVERALEISGRKGKVEVYYVF